MSVYILRQWARRSKIEFIKVGRHIRFELYVADDILARLESGDLRRPGKIAKRRLEAGSTYPDPGQHLDMVLVDDPSGELVVGFGRFERGSWVETALEGYFPDGSIWRGERGTKADTLYRLDGLRLKEIADYSRHGRIANALQT